MAANDVFDDEFDYAGKDYVAAPGWVRGLKRKGVGEKPLSALSEGLIGDLQRKTGASPRQLYARKVWSQMHDPLAVKHVTGLFYAQKKAGNELVAYVDGSAWMYRFTMSAPAHLQEWNHLCEVNDLPMKAVKLTFRLGKAARKAGDDGSLRSGGAEVEVRPVPLTEAERAEVMRRVSVISDPTLRKKAYEAMVSVMELQKGENLKRNL